MFGREYLHMESRAVDLIFFYYTSERLSFLGTKQLILYDNIGMSIEIIFTKLYDEAIKIYAL